MSISQIGVFVENHPGHVARVLDAFVEAEVQVRGYCMSDTGDYGIVRFVVDNPEKAKRCWPIWLRRGRERGFVPAPSRQAGRACPHHGRVREAEH